MGLRHESRRYERISAAKDLLGMTAKLLANDRERLTWKYPADVRARIIANIKQRIARGEELMARYRRQLD